MSQQRQLLEPFPTSVIKQVDKGKYKADYVSWTDKIQRLIQVLGGFEWSVGDPFLSGEEHEPVGLRGTLTVTIDGETRRVDGVGSGRDAKKAETDAFARACSKIGLGLHLWTQGGTKDGGYWIAGRLDKDEEEKG